MNRSVRHPVVPPPALEACIVYQSESVTAAFDAGVTDPGVPESARPPPPPRIDSGRLFGDRRELVIEHAGCEYRLRRTRTDKLILTK